MVSVAEGVRIGLGCALAAGAGVLPSVACGNGLGQTPSIVKLEQALCNKLVECGCGESFADSGLLLPVTCEGWTLADALSYGDDGDDGYDYGYGYEGGYEEPDQLPRSVDEQCLQQIVARVDGLACDAFFAVGGADCHEFCWPVIGPRFAGEPCVTQSDCGRGLLCHHAECIEPCTMQPPGEGDPCESAAECPQGLVCGEQLDSDERVCVVLPTRGQPCYLGACAPGLGCGSDNSGNEVCVRLTEEGAPCMGHLECASRYCPAGFCALAPGENQGCGASDACAAGTECVEDEQGNATCRLVASQCFALLDSVLEVAISVSAAGGQ